MRTFIFIKNKRKGNNKMRVVCVYRDRQDYTRSVDEWLENFRRQTGREIETMDPDKVYYIRFKSVLDDVNKEFYMDYIEFCAKEVYDNPETPEDIW